MILLLDQGNHRLKWRRAGNDQDAVRPTAAAAWDEDWRSALGRDLDTPPLPSQAFVASVAGAERGAKKNVKKKQKKQKKEDIKRQKK